MALCMSVNPGWGDQELIPASLSKLQRMRAALPDHVVLEVDGGVHREHSSVGRRSGGESACHRVGGIRR